MGGFAVRTTLPALAALILVVAIAACGGGELNSVAFETTAPVAAQPDTTAAAPATTMASDDHMDDHSDTTMAHDDDDSAHSDDEAEATHDDSADEDAVPADRDVEILMTEFAFAPESVTVAAGETIRFVLTNEGVVPHEFRLSNEHRIEEHIAAGHEDHEEEGGHHEGGDIFIEVEAGATDEITMTFPEDTTLYTDIACLIPGHFEAGMHAELTYDA